MENKISASFVINDFTCTQSALDLPPVYGAVLINYVLCIQIKRCNY